MLHRSLSLRRVSPFSVYMRDLARQNKLVGTNNAPKIASAGYRKLSAEEKAELVKRARSLSYPALDAYNRFQKEYSHRFLHLSNKERQRKVAQLWAELKEKGTVRIPKAPKVKGAKKTVKIIAKVKRNAASSRPVKAKAAKA
ncbi:unnamed protein product [Phytomonas sp. EM1]|nr:unnamed protein product [Phytomonas sp. EM1]|eukprot:CCW60286.1 unnamed protein product [Phytomonas sp. isolate EM1]